MNVESLVRSGVVLVVGLPITLGVAVSGLKGTTSANADAIAESKAELVDVCLKYSVAKNDSKLEREAKDEIDKRMRADGTNYGGLCQWVLS